MEGMMRQLVAGLRGHADQDTPMVVLDAVLPQVRLEQPPVVRDFPLPKPWRVRPLQFSGDD
jgi:hypothetical protein